MANPNLSGDWTRVPESRDDSASIQTTPGQTICIRARHVSEDGNVSEWDYIEHDVTGKLDQKETPIGIIVAGAQGQISVRYEPPPIEDFDYIQIAIGTSTDPLESAVVYEGRDKAWVSRRSFQPSSRYYVFLRGLDTSRNPSGWTEGIAVDPRPLTGGSARVFSSHSRQPNLFVGDTGDLYVVLNSGVLWSRSSAGWWNTQINVHSEGPTRYRIPSSSAFVPAGQTPQPGQLGVPIAAEIPDGSTASGDDGRIWTWSLGGQRFFEAGDITPQTNIPSSLPDWIVNEPPTGCGRIIPVTRFPPRDLPDALEGFEGETKPAYDICVSDDGAIGDFINGKWTARQIRWKSLSQDGEVIFRKDTPNEWTWFDKDPVESNLANQYGSKWRTVVSLNLGVDSTGADYYGQMYIRNFRNQNWEKYYQICDPNVPEPAAPRNPMIATRDVENRVQITLTWDAPSSRLPPAGYRYRLFEKEQFDDDGTRINLMGGYTTFLTAAAVRDVDPPTRYYLEVRAEYVDGNSRWVRVEALIGLACAEDPPPLAPALSYSGVALTSGTFNGVPGVTTRGGLLSSITFNWGYPGSGTRPAYWAWESGPNNLNPYIQPSEPGGDRGDIQLTDPDGNQYTVYPDRFPGHTNPTSWLQPPERGAREQPGLVGLMSGRMLSRCGSVFRWGARSIIDIMRAEALTGFSWRYNQNLRINNLANVTPQGTAAGTFHFQYRVAGSDPSGAGVQAVQILIRGWHMDEYGRPDVFNDVSDFPGISAFNVTIRADTASGTRARNISSLAPIGSGSGAKEITLTTGNQGTDRILVVSGIPTDFDGFYSISMRYRDADSSATSLTQSTYGNWSSIRFQQIGQRRPPPAPTVGIPLNVTGNESPQSSLTWEFAWIPPLADADRNILLPTGYSWDISGRTVRSGFSVLPRISVPNLNTGNHTLTLRSEAGVVRSLPVTYPFFVRDGPVMCTVREPRNGRQIPSGQTGLSLVQFDAPSIGARPTVYPWTLTATGPPPGGTVTPTVPAGSASGNASATTTGGIVRISNLPRGTYQIDIRSSGCVPVQTSAGSLSVAVVVTGRTPDQPFPPRNLRTEEAAARTTFASFWQAPTSPPVPDGYEYKIDGSTTQSARSTAGFTATHANLNSGEHTLSVRSTKTGSQPSVWATKTFFVRGEGCNPIESLEEGIGGTRTNPIWNARKIFWAAPVGGMTPTGYIWELFAASDGSRVQNGTTAAANRSIDIFNLEEGTYTISVRANCADGPSDVKSRGFTVVCPPPEPPELPEVVVSGLTENQQANATWRAPSTGGSPTGYIWEVVGPESRTDTVPPSTLSVLLEDLPKGEYQFRIRTTGDCNKNSTNQIVHFEIGGTSTCQSPRLLRKQEGAIWSTWSVFWLAPSYGDNPVRYDWRMDGPTQSSGSVVPDQSDNLSGNATIDNLSPGLYTFFVKNVCNLNPTPPDTGESKESSISIRVTRKAPENPRNVSVESATASIVDASNPCPPTPTWVGTWDAPTGGTSPSNYDWELYDSSNTKTLDSTVPSITRRAVLGRLSPGSYRFQVRSKSGTQTSGWESYGFTVPADDLNPPQITSANSTTINQSEQWTITWDKNPCGVEPDGYTWRWRQRGGTSDINTPTKGTAKTATLTGGTNGTTYVFYVKAHSGSRESREVQRQIPWGSTLEVNPPESLSFRSLNPPEGSNVRFIWEDPSTGREPVRFNWTLTGPGVNRSGDQIQLRQGFSGLQSGTYSFSVRTDIRTSTSTPPSVGTNVSVWVTIGYVVIGPANCAPGEISLVETGSVLRGPNWKGGLTAEHRIQWGASHDNAVTGYDWIGTWSHIASTGSTDAGDGDRVVQLGSIPIGTYTITVHGKKGTSRCGSRAKQFRIVQRDLEPPSSLEVSTTGDAADGWTHSVSYDPPETGRLVTGFEYRNYGSEDEVPTVWHRTTDTSFNLSGLEDGDWRIDVRTYDSEGSSDYVSERYSQPPARRKIGQPENVIVRVGTGASWNTASVTWRKSSDEGEPDPDFYGWILQGPSESDGTESSPSTDFSDLDPGEYTFSVFAVKDNYEDSDRVGAAFSIMEPPPDPVGSLSCMPGSRRTQKIVTWREPTGITAPTGYAYSVTGATTVPQTPLGQGTTRFTIELATGKSTVTVIATKGDLESEESSVECTVAATTCKPPRDLTATQNPNNNKVWTLRWKPPELEKDDPAITGFEYELTGTISRTRTMGPLNTIEIFNDLTQGSYAFKVRTLCGTMDPSDFTPEREFAIEGGSYLSTREHHGFPGRE